jgi:hypothetical protein
MASTCAPAQTMNLPATYRGRTDKTRTRSRHRAVRFQSLATSWSSKIVWVSAHRRVDCDGFAVGVLVAGVSRGGQDCLGPLVQH